MAGQTEPKTVEIVRLYVGRGLRTAPFGADDEKLELSVDLQDLGAELDAALDYLGHHLSGDLADIPAAGLVPVGSLYAADDGVVYQSDGETWAAWATGGGGGGGGDPASDAAVWMPLTTTVAGDDVLVFDADHSLIPTLLPL